MKKYIFITHEGCTFQPGSEAIEPDVENLQVVGFADGNSPGEAVRNLLKEAAYLKEMSFNEVTALELKSQKRTYHCLEDLK